MIETAISEIKNKLKKVFNNFAIDDYPDDFNKYNFTAPDGCLLVRYDASTFSTPEAIDIISQDETLEFALFIGLRYKKFKECYPYLKQIKNALTGLKINGSKLFAKKCQFIKKIKSDFWWAYTFNLNSFTEQTENLGLLPEEGLWIGV